MKMKIIEVGKVFRFHGLRLKVINAVDGCRGCYFKNRTSCEVDIVGACCQPWRLNNIIFRKYDNNKLENYHSKQNKKHNEKK